MTKASSEEMSTETERSPRGPVRQAERIVLKVGTAVLTHTDGTTALARLFHVVETAARLRQRGREVLIVTSGAVGLGRAAVGRDEGPVSAELKQMYAAIGQSRLMELYQHGFARLGVVCAQILITWTDFDDRLRYLNLHGTLETLLENGVVPVINENDAISLNDRVYEGTGRRPIFDDNDLLSALVASELAADLLVVLTDVPGVMTADPRRSPDATLVDRIDDPDEPGVDVSGGSSAPGRGGMKTKLAAASIASRAGCQTVIASGIDPDALGRVLAGERVGTWIPAGEALSRRSRWIAFCSHPKGVLYADEGAVRALRESGASLLAVGVTRIEGSFRRGDVVEIKDAAGELVGRGIVPVDVATATAWAGGRAPEGARNRHALVDREHLVLKERLARRGAVDG